MIKTGPVFNIFDDCHMIQDEINDYRIRFKNNTDSLNAELNLSAFRRGVSTEIQGIMKLAPSDHLPITTTFGNISITSWNLLSDEHTHNFLYALSRKQHFLKNSKRPDGNKVIWNDFFKDFAIFFLKKSVRDSQGNYQINITEKLLTEYVSEKQLQVQEVQKTKHEVPEALQDSVKNAEKFLNLILDTDNIDHNEFKKSLVHVFEIMQPIVDGYLQWPNRLEKIKENKKFLQSLLSQDIFCFQECTSPKDMLDLLSQQSKANKLSKKFAMIEFRITEKDNCVIIYDETKFRLEAKSDFGLAPHPKTKKVRKPCMVARLKILETDEQIIVGSIHHPGTGESELSTIMKEANALTIIEGVRRQIPIFVAGDYNHQKHFYAQDIANTEFVLSMPSQGTMAGFEYGNYNKPIDGILTNRGSDIKVSVIDQFTFASQVDLPIKVNIDIKPKVNITNTNKSSSQVIDRPDNELERNHKKPSIG